MISYPSRLDENISRPVAISVFTIALITLLRPDLSWLIYLLTVDFVLRYIHPKLSPLVLIYNYIDKNLLGNSPHPYYAPPKRFAILLGVIMSTLISLFYIAGLDLIAVATTFMLLFASFLQGFFSYCIGCKFYDILIQFGLIQSSSEYIDTKHLNRW